MHVAHRALDSAVPTSPAGALSLAVRVWMCRIALDRELAEGANPTTDAARGLRARQLSSRRCRRHVASGLRLLVRQALEPSGSPVVAVVPVNRRQVLEASDLLLMLAGRLEEAEDPCPRAVALASFLVSDPDSPAILWIDESHDPFRSDEHATTAQLARAALEAIDRRPLR